MVSVEFDPEVNTVYIRLKEGKVAESEPLVDNIVVDLDEKGEVVGIEKSLHLIRELREIVFTDDLAKTPEELLKRFEGRKHDLRRAVEVLLSVWVSEKQISYPEAVKLFRKLCTCYVH